MRAARLFSLAVAAIALAAAPLRAQAPAADSVLLRFAWPVGTEARVAYTQVIEREGDSDRPIRVEIEGEYTLHVHQHPQGLLIEHLDPLAIRLQASPPFDPTDPRGAIYSRLGTPTPHYVVSPEGRLLGVDGVPALAAAITAIFAPGSAQAGALDPLLRELLNEPLLAGTARERWNALVGMWLDASLKVGEVSGAEAEEANPLLPSVVLPYVYEFRLVGTEPCGASGPAAAKRCARLQMLSLPDPAQLAQVMSKALVDMGFPNLSFDGLAQHSQVTLLTDPETLLPYEVTMTKLVQGILKDGAQSRVFRRADETRLAYTYP